MVLYLDLAFALNALTDMLALYVTARFAGQAIRWRRAIPASIVGGVYGVICSFPSLSGVRSFPVQILVAILMVLHVFKRKELLLRLSLLFFLLSCTLGGACMAFARFISEQGSGELLKILDWKAFLLVGAICWFLLSVTFRSTSQHIVSGQISSCSIQYSGRIVQVNALLDTGHTLFDPFSGAPVLTIWGDAIRELWSEKEWNILSQIEGTGSLACLEELSEIVPGKFFPLPYQSVGIRRGVLLCFRPDEVVIDGVRSDSVVVALSPTPVSDGNGYVALWGGERGLFT